MDGDSIATVDLEIATGSAFPAIEYFNTFVT